MPQHLHNEDAVIFFGNALEWIQQQHSAGHKPKCAMTLMWKDRDGDTHVFPALLTARPTAESLALTSRLHGLRLGAEMGEDESVSLLLTKAYYTSRLRTAFTLVRRHGEPTLLITEHLRSSNVALPKPTPLREVSRKSELLKTTHATQPISVNSSEITYDDGPFNRMPDAVFALFQAFATEMPDLVDAKGSPFCRHPDANPIGAGRLSF